jgi:hypothetical protein
VAPELLQATQVEEAAMSSPFRSGDDAGAVLRTYVGVERLLIEQAMREDELQHRWWRRRRVQEPEPHVAASSPRAVPAGS